MKAGAPVQFLLETCANSLVKFTDTSAHVDLVLNNLQSNNDAETIGVQASAHVDDGTTGICAGLNSNRGERTCRKSGNTDVWRGFAYSPVVPNSTSSQSSHTCKFYQDGQIVWASGLNRSGSMPLRFFYL